MSETFFTGPLTRSKADKHKTVKGEMQVLLDTDNEFFAFVYDPVNFEVIYQLEAVTSAPLTRLTYNVHPKHKTWVAGIFTSDLAFVNIFHSVDGKHRPELCWKYIEAGILFDLSSFASLPPALKTSMAKVATAAAAKKAAKTA
jgi:hypothetical protein